MNKIICLFYLITFSLIGFAQAPQMSTSDVQSYGHAININIPNSDYSEGDFYYADADKNEKKGELNEALILFGKAAFEYNSDKKQAKYANSLLRLSNVHYQLNHFIEAEQMVLNLALKAYAKLGNKIGQMQSYGQLGKIYAASNKYTQSMWFYTQQGILAEQLRHQNGRIESILGIALVKAKKKEYNLALKDILKAENLAKSLKNTHYNSQIQQQRTFILSKQNPKPKV
ncbi:MAG: hypothetical protein EOO99_05960 [Pedobacter sp.]|nr:MAG: hypothetical protein EOO99_05960 [Pedobacter sp.]